MSPSARQHYADVVRRLVRRLRDEPAPSLPSDRRRLVAAVEQALHARARVRVRVRRAAWLAGGVAAAAAALLVVPRLVPVAHDVAAARHAPRMFTVLGADDIGTATATVGGQAPMPVRRGMALRQGLRLVAPSSGEVRVGTAEGTSLALEATSDLTVAEVGDTQRFSLRAGAVRARVSRLFAGERFIVDTTDAEVEVHGTAFRVAIVAADPACGGGTTTRVSVDEGVVTVRQGGREGRVAPGEAWPAGCGAGIAATIGARSAAPTHVSSTASRASARVGRIARDAAWSGDRRREDLDRAPAEQPAPAIAAAVAPVAPPPSTTAPVMASGLGAENDLFLAGVRARKDGRLAEAVRLFGKLCDDHPRSPLAESAAVQRMRVLAAIAPVQGARAAAEYLARYPGGFARADAQALIDRARP